MSIQTLPCGTSPNAPPWQFGMKHVTAQFHPPSGRLYFNNGDYRGIAPYQNQSYNQETWSLDLAVRLASTDPNAGWRLEYPYAGFGGTTVQPKHPDFCAFAWDASRGVFWSVPGQWDGYGIETVPGETPGHNSDPNFLSAHVMQFNPSLPMEQRWKDITADQGPDPLNQWMSIYDPVRDRLVRPGYSGGSGSVLNIFDCKTLTWLPRVGLKNNALGKDVRLNKAYLAPDFANRKVYGADTARNRVMAFSLDTYAIEDCGPAPGALISNEQFSHLVYDSNHKVLQFYNMFDLTLYVADATVRPLVWTVAATNMKARMGVFDPKNDVSLWAGWADTPLNPNLTLINFSTAQLPEVIMADINSVIVKQIAALDEAYTVAGQPTVAAQLASVATLESQLATANSALTAANAATAAATTKLTNTLAAVAALEAEDTVEDAKLAAVRAAAT